MGNQESQCDYDDEATYKNDDLFCIQGEKLNDLLHRSVGALTFLNYNKQMGVGNAVLISKDTILTAAHNILHKKTKIENTQFKFYIGVDGVAETYYQIEAWKYPKEFKICPEKGRIQFDYAIMKLKKPIQFDRYLLLSLTCEKCLISQQQKFLRIFGFPQGYKDNFYPLDEYGNKIKLHQYGLARQNRILLVDASKFLMRYGITTLPGQSGCPVILDDCIVAVHVGGANEFNVGRILDITFINNIKLWAQMMKVSQFGRGNINKCDHIRLTKENLSTQLRFKDRKLEIMDLSQYSNLLKLDLSNNKLRQIDIRPCSQLKVLTLFENQLRFIDLTYNIYLTDATIWNNQLQKIDVSSNLNLIYLSLGWNKLQSINVMSNINLIYLSLSSNQLKNIDLSKNMNLTSLHLANNQLFQIDLSCNINLTQINLSNNKLQKVDVRPQLNLQIVRLYDNEITEIDFTKNQQLYNVDIARNHLASIYLAFKGNMIEEQYLKVFRYSDQRSTACRVELRCIREAACVKGRGKALMIAEKLRQKYSDSSSNKYGCKFSYWVI